MVPFHLEIEDNLLSIRYDPTYPADNDEIVKDISLQLENLVQQGLLCGGEILKINGKQTVPLSYVIAHTVAHLYGAIAVFDPKLQKYVVAISHSPKYKIGDLLE